MAEKGGRKILIIVTICILLVSIMLSWYFGDDDEGDSDEISIEVEVVDKGNYWEITIIETKGETIYLPDAKFSTVRSNYLGGSHRIDSLEIANPSSISIDDSTVYPIPLKDPVIENSTYGDGEIIDINSVAQPELWELCFWAYIDAKSDNYINTGDYIWVFKDIIDDGIDDIKPGYEFWIYKNRDNIITKIKL